MIRDMHFCGIILEFSWFVGLSGIVTIFSTGITGNRYVVSNLLDIAKLNAVLLRGKTVSAKSVLIRGRHPSIPTSTTNIYSGLSHDYELRDKEYENGNEDDHEQDVNIDNQNEDDEDVDVEDAGQRCMIDEDILEHGEDEETNKHYHELNGNVGEQDDDGYDDDYDEQEEEQRQEQMEVSGNEEVASPVNIEQTGVSHDDESRVKEPHNGNEEDHEHDVNIDNQKMMMRTWAWSGKTFLEVTKWPLQSVLT
jgi:hypothetical protein